MNNIEEFDALTLEYKRNYGTARRELKFSDFMDDSLLQSPIGIFGLSLFEELCDFPFIQIGITGDNIPNSVLVT